MSTFIVCLCIAKFGQVHVYVLNPLRAVFFTLFLFLFLFLCPEPIKSSPH